MKVICTVPGLVSAQYQMTTMMTIAALPSPIEMLLPMIHIYRKIHKINDNPHTPKLCQQIAKIIKFFLFAKTKFLTEQKLLS